jgi:hypothetical protein
MQQAAREAGQQAAEAAQERVDSERLRVAIAELARFGAPLSGRPGARAGMRRRDR